MIGDASLPQPGKTILKSYEFSGCAGVARGDITPPSGIYFRLWGSAKHDTPSGVHRPLLATCIAFADETRGPPLVLLTLDLSWWRSRDDEWGLRSAVLAASGLDEDRLIMQPSHTHSAPSTGLDLADKPGGHLVAGFREHVRQTCIRLVAEARAALAPAVATWAVGRCGLACNRNFPSPETGEILCGINPAIDADDTVLVGRVTDAAGRIMATLVNYACHPISLGGGNTLVSPDYVGAMRETIEKESGGAPCLFLHGASGDLAPRRSFESDVGIADQNGRELGYAALSALTSMLPPGSALAYAGVEQSGTPLARWRERPAAPSRKTAASRATVRLQVADMPTRDELDRQMAACEDRTLRERLNRALLRREAVGDAAEVDVSFLVWRLGDAIFVAIPAEMHGGFQVELRRRFPEIRIAVMNIANGSLGYIPPAEEFTLHTYQAAIALHKVGSVDRVMEAATLAIREMLEGGRVRTNVHSEPLPARQV
jgi:hypothetical protein